MDWTAATIAHEPVAHVKSETCATEGHVLGDASPLIFTYPHARQGFASPGMGTHGRAKSNVPSGRKKILEFWRKKSHGTGLTAKFPSKPEE